jgi:hypothetical protein
MSSLVTSPEETQAKPDPSMALRAEAAKAAIQETISRCVEHNWPINTDALSAESTRLYVSELIMNKVLNFEEVDARILEIKANLLAAEYQQRCTQANPKLAVVRR